MDKTTQERIKADAEAATGKRFPGDAANFEYLEYEAGYIEGATAENSNIAPMYDALMELLALKELKDTHGKTPEYLKRQPIAWQRLKEVLNKWKDGGKEVEKEIEYMPVHPEDARKPDCPKQFPMHLLDEDQAQINHGQTLKRLKERGGLSVREILAIVDKKGWNYYGNLQWPEAIKMLNDILTNPTK